MFTSPEGVGPGRRVVLAARVPYAGWQAVLPAIGSIKVVARFFRAFHTLSTIIPEKCNFCQDFLLKIAENLKTSIILRNLRFFVNIFSEKIAEKCKLSRKIAKNV